MCDEQGKNKEGHLKLMKTCYESSAACLDCAEKSGKEECCETQCRINAELADTTARLMSLNAPQVDALINLVIESSQKCADICSKWLCENEATFPKVRFDEDKNGMGGSYAVQPIHPNEIIATLPLNLTLTPKLARESLPILTSLSCRAALATFLVHERLLGNLSFYHPYINILPKNISTPLTYSEREMLWLKGTNLGPGSENRKEILRKEFEEVLKVVSNGEFIDGLSWELYMWACDVISSRSFPNKLVNPDDTETKEALFPLIDSFNHKPRQKITWEVHERNKLRLVASDYIEAGQQIYNNYGSKSNEELLVGYGFCIPDNPDDWVVIKVNISQDPQCDEKLDLLSSLGLSEITHFIKKDNIPSNLLSQLRVLVMNSAELIYFRKLQETRNFNVNNSINEPIGYRNELAMLKTFSNLLKMKLEILLDRDEEFCDDKIMSVKESESMMNFLAKDELLDSLLITIDKVMKIDKKFSKAIHEIFSNELLVSEEDTILILYLIYESQYIENSKWKLFFEVAIKYDDFLHIQELTELYDELQPLVCNPDVKLFEKDVFSIDKLIWSTCIFEICSITFNNKDKRQTFGIVPL
ncbi:2184_t:CDS:10 [Scutellospora calospora]|uniref:2184_t:CDS:1 n=1 Tax=Scutellospora calospora TaxID=85575 RepID=A0ACA9K296_9GLOM|nr:2184_t:CDS:10 [Scutellospora calospora]